MPDLTILLLAAGASSRMRGRDKLLEQVAGQPLLRLQAQRALATGLPVLVTLPPDAAPRRAALKDLPVTLIEVPDAATGMSASLRAAAARVTGALMVLPADMPEIDTQDMKALIAAFDQSPDTCHRGAAAKGEPGHPVIFPARLVPNFATLNGDEGARSLLKQHGARLVTLPGTHALTDLDTPEDWKAWRNP